VDRYDLVDPVVAVVDNKRVIDEVEFYIIENRSQVKYQNLGGASFAKEEGSKIFGMFIGTDFTFKHSKYL